MNMSSDIDIIRPSLASFTIFAHVKSNRKAQSINICVHRHLILIGLYSDLKIAKYCKILRDWDLLI